MIVKKLFSSVLILTLAFGAASAQKKDAKKPEQPKGYVFTTVKANPITSIKNQSRSSTCWCFSGIAFLESEAIRKGTATQDLDLAEMFVVGHAYVDRGDKFVRLNGKLNYSPGSSFGDVIATMETYGLVPQSVYPGIRYGEPIHVHGELDATTRAYVTAVSTNPNRKYSPVWKEGLSKIVETYLGEFPEKFTVNGKEYTPQSYAASLDLNPEDYVSITSFTHHPFYKTFALEVPDNWRGDANYNLPLDEMIQVIDNAIENGYTVAWAADVSEKGFTRQGIAIVADTEANERNGSDQDRWLGVTPENKAAIISGLAAPGVEKTITQEMRQHDFDAQLTTDDHGMLIFGIAKDQNGTKYYMVKNSWGETGPYKGIWYVSEPYVRFKTTNIMVNKASIPQPIQSKMGL